MHEPNKPNGSRVVGVPCWMVRCMCCSVRAWSMGSWSPSSRWRRSSANSGGLASSGSPSAQKTVLPGRLYSRYSISSRPYRRAGSARTCGGMEILMSGAPVGMSWVVMVGVMRLTGTSCWRWVAAGFGFDAAGVRSFGGACLVPSSGPCGLGSAWGLVGERVLWGVE